MAVETFDYDEMAADAVELIEEFGRSLTLRYFTETGPEYNPTRTSHDVAVKGCIVDFSDSKISGGLVLATDKRALIAPDASVAPTTDMQLVEAGSIYEIVNVNTVNPAGTVVLFDCQVRR